MAAAPKGLFLVGPPVLELDGDEGTGQQPLCFVDQRTHDMRIGYYTDTYRRTDGLAAADPVHDLPAQERGPGLGAGPRPDPAHPAAPDGAREFRPGVGAWLDDHEADLTPSPGSVETLDAQMDHLAVVKRLTFDAGWMRWGWPERVGGLGGSTLLRAYLGEALTARDWSSRASTR